MIYCKLKNKEMALEYLNKACDLAILQDIREDNIHHKSLLFNLMSDKGENMTWSGSKEDYGNRCYECSNHILNYPIFDYIRNEAKFSEIAEKLSKYKKQYNEKM